MTDPNANPHKQLLDRFRRDLALPAAERFYTEEEVVSVFDNAGDGDNDYLRLEALLLGARLYPDSPDLLERRAIFYRMFPGSTFDEFLADNAAVSRPLWDIIKMSRFAGTAEDARKMLEDYIAVNRLDTDEEVIQFIGLANTFGASEWVFDNIELIRSKVSYEPTFYYEVAALAETAGRHDIDVAMLEKLTEIEAYCADYWVLLASAYLAEKREADAAYAIDLALAIDPDDVRAMRVKLELLSADDPQCMPLAERIVELDPSDRLTAARVIAVLALQDELPRAYALFDKAMEVPGLSLPLAVLAVKTDYPDVSKVLEEFCLESEDTEIEKLADKITNDGTCSDGFEALSEAYKTVKGMPFHHDFLMIKMLYHAGLYEQVQRVFFEQAENGTIRRPGNIVTAFAIMVQSLLRSGAVDDARRVVSEMIDTIDGNWTTGIPMQDYGFVCYLNEVMKKLNSKRNVNWHKFDPLGLDQ